MQFSINCDDLRLCLIWFNGTPELHVLFCQYHVKVLNEVLYSDSDSDSFNDHSRDCIRNTNTPVEISLSHSASIGPDFDLLQNTHFPKPGIDGSRLHVVCHSIRSHFHTS